VDWRIKNIENIVTDVPRSPLQVVEPESNVIDCVKWHKKCVEGQNPVDDFCKNGVFKWCETGMLLESLGVNCCLDPELLVLIGVDGGVPKCPEGCL
jgi:hypothetical protein